MYEDFFRFDDRPFPSTPRVEFYFPSSSAENAHQTLARCIGRAEGPGLLIGGAGTGKSVLCQLLATRFRDAFHVVMLTSARLCTRRALLQHILFELGLPYRGLEEGELRLSLIDFLKQDKSNREGVLLLVDEAHTLPIRLVEEIRMITNSLHDGQPSVRLVLVGGPALEERLASPRLESLNQRIAARCYLQPLNYEETFEYVRSQIITVGGDPARVFTEDSLAAVHQTTDGVPRLINQVCDHALVLGVVNQHEHVDARLIEEAWSDLQQLPAPFQGTPTEATGGESVIEFGALEEPEFQEPREEEFFVPEPAVESDEIDLTKQLDGIETSVARVAEEEAASSAMQGYEELANDAFSEEAVVPSVEMPAEPTDEIQPAAESGEDASVPQTDNPFDESFGDEEIIVDHYSRLHEANQPVETATSSNQGCELDAATEAIFHGNECRRPDVNELREESGAGEPDEEADAAISEQATFDEMIVQANPQFAGPTQDIEDTVDQEHSPDTAVYEVDDIDESVPVQASVMRVPPDDSDLIVVVDEELDKGQASSDTGSHRQDYRRLFSKLRET